jgi:hypothetical protein
MLASQASQLTKFESTVFATLASQFDGYRKTQAESMSSDVDMIRDSLQHGHDDRLAAADARKANLSELEQNETSVREVLLRGQTRMEELVGEGKEVRGTLLLGCFLCDER